MMRRIYYESSFNKKNYFFGKTRLFIPKKDIYEINKQTGFLVFPDVIEVKTNKGQLYFHALGKRDKMYEAFINTYFPEVQQCEEGPEKELEFEFYEFKGQDTSHRKAFSMKPYSCDIGESVLKNADLRAIFRRYLSDDPFTYQGVQYQNFKTYSFGLVKTINPQTNQITPPPPYYFAKKGESISDQVAEYSVRIAKFQKKIPMIPFVSKGGNAFCEQTSKYYWGSPDYFVVDILSIMKGFKFTESMELRIMCIYKQDREKNQVKCSVSCDIAFTQDGALNNTIKGEALTETKWVIQTVSEAMRKNEKNRKVYKNKGNNLQQIDEEKEDFREEIERLKNINKSLNKKMYRMGIAFACVYILTIIFLQWNHMVGEN